MPANSETILSQQNHPGDSTTETITSEKFKGDGYYGRSDGFHTVQYNLTGFIGTVTIQATLAIDPADTDWFTVYTKDYPEINGEPNTINNLTNFTGNYVWIRAVINYTDGTINSIILNH